MRQIDPNQATAGYLSERRAAHQAGSLVCAFGRTANMQHPLIAFPGVVVGD